MKDKILKLLDEYFGDLMGDNNKEEIAEFVVSNSDEIHRIIYNDSYFKR